MRLCGLRSPAANLTNGRLITIICCGGFRVYFHICPAKLFVLSAEMIQGAIIRWFFDWFGNFCGGIHQMILSYRKTPPPFIFESVRKWEEKWHHKGMHKYDKLTLINALHLSYKNILRNFVGNFFLASFATLDLFCIQYSKNLEKNSVNCKYFHIFILNSKWNHIQLVQR